jgi:hypothetical protein
VTLLISFTAIADKHFRLTAMFDLQLDLKMYFIPPMEENRNAIRLTRKLQLPFAPYNELAVYNPAMDTYPMQEGMTLKNVVWDMQRSRFTAETTFEQHDLPLVHIAAELASWVKIGWRMGSYLDDLAEDMPDDFDDANNDAEPEETSEVESPEIECAIDPDDLIPTLPPRKRDKSFNKLFRALIRVVAEEQPGTPTTYAMWKSGRLFSEKQLKDNDTMPAKQFQQAMEEFRRMDFSKQFDWSMKVCRFLPRIDRVVAESMRSGRN